MGLPVLLNIGGIAPHKSQNTILDLAARLHRRNCEFLMHFIGKIGEQSPYALRFQREVAQAEKEGYANTLGEKTPEELIAIMDGASGMVHLPLEESFGLVVAEGLARNLKFFGAKTGGVVDIATGVEGAELFDPGDLGSLEEAIAQWLTQGHPKMTQAAGTMRERYHPSIIAGKHVEIYREIIGCHGQHGNEHVGRKNP